MNAKQKNVLLNLIASHVKAQVEASWKGTHSAEDRLKIGADAREATEDLTAFIDSLTDAPPELGHVLKLQNEVRLLNRAMQRKNRKLKGQYEALHGLRFTVDAAVDQGTAYRVYKALDDVMKVYRGLPGLGDRLLGAMVKAIKGIPQ